MKIRKRNKNKMKYAPRYRGNGPNRKNVLYYEDSCCRGCYWDWGHAFMQRHLYKHDCTESNYLGLLKKYWKTSQPDYFAEFKDTEDLK